MKPTKIFVKPSRPGMKLAHPVSGWLPDAGRRWLDDSFTRRRIADGGIVIADPDAPEPQVEALAGDDVTVRIAPVPSPVASASRADTPLPQTASEK